MSFKADHFAFQVSSLEASVEFYHHVLGLKIISKTVDVAHHEAFAFLELDGGNLELLQLLDEKNNPLPFKRAKIEPPYCPHLAIAAENLDQLVAMLRDKNVEIVKGPLEIPGTVKWLYIADPDQNVIEFVQWLG